MFIDPEIYSELAVTYPRQVKAIFIRRAPEQRIVVSATETAQPKEEAKALDNGSAEENGAVADDDVVQSIIESIETTNSNETEITLSQESFEEKQETAGIAIGQQQQQQTEGVSEQDMECLVVELSEERKNREEKRFGAIFDPIREHTLCKVFSDASELEKLSLQELLHG